MGQLGISEDITLLYLDVGKRAYKETWDIQKILHRKRRQDEIPDTLILVEHYPVITLGRTGKEANLLIPYKQLAEKRIEFFRVERGGDITFHGPGQLIGYPIFNIKKGLAGVKPFIMKIEDAIIRALAEFDIEGRKRDKQIGVWTDTGKICSIGIAVQQGTSFHGFALNVNTDLNYFDYIVPCGLNGVKMTSMQEVLKREIPMANVKEVVAQAFAQVFSKSLKEVCLKEII